MTREEREKLRQVAQFREKHPGTIGDTAVFGANTILSLINACDRLEARCEKLEQALRSLKNEAKGFLSMANKADHGVTNMQVLQHWIDNAEQALAHGKEGE